MILPPQVATRYAQAGLDPYRLGIEIEHREVDAGGWVATIPLDDLILLLALAVGRSRSTT